MTLFIWIGLTPYKEEAKAKAKAEAKEDAYAKWLRHPRKAMLRPAIAQPCATAQQPAEAKVCTHG